MRPEDPTGEMPMPRDRYLALLARRPALAPWDRFQAVPDREQAPVTSELAAQLLAEAAGRELESGELLLVSEEATLADLEAAAAGIEVASQLPAVPDGDPLFGTLAAPRLLGPRLWQLFDWQPDLEQHLRLLAGALRAGLAVPQQMLIGHLETFPERVEHLVRLRHVLRAGRQTGGRVVIAVRQAGPDDLASINDGAVPATTDSDRRHAVAVARLALGPRTVTLA
jgi:hypothetical protein